MKQHGLHAAVVRQVHADLGLPYILLCSIQLRLVDDLSDKALWLEELVVSQGSEALKLLLVLGVHVNLYKGGHTRPKEARINFFPISWEPRDIHIDFLIAVILQQLSVEGGSPPCPLFSVPAQQATREMADQPCRLITVICSKRLN